MLQPTEFYLIDTDIFDAQMWLSYAGTSRMPGILVAGPCEGRFLIRYGNTRTYGLHQAGMEEIDVTLTNEDLSFYQSMAVLAREQGVHHVRDLEHRIVDEKTYEKEMIRKCVYQRQLNAKLHR